MQGKMTTAKRDTLVDGDASVRRISAGDASTELANHLLKNGYLTDKQIEYARRVQTKLEASRPLLQVIKELRFITDDRIKEAIRKHPVSMRIGALLVEMGHLETADLQTALGIQAEEKSKRKLGEIPYKTEGYQQAKWLLIDYVNIVVHILQPEQRKFYRIEEMWSDANLEQHD